MQGIVARRLVDIRDALVKERLNALALLAAAGLLDIKLALRLDKNGQFSPRISPEKAGIRADSDGNHVAFFVLQRTCLSATATLAGHLPGCQSTKQENPKHRQNFIRLTALSRAPSRQTPSVPGAGPVARGSLPWQPGQEGPPTALTLASKVAESNRRLVFIVVSCFIND